MARAKELIQFFSEKIADGSYGNSREICMMQCTLLRISIASCLTTVRPTAFATEITWLITSRCSQTGRRDFVCGVPCGEQFFIYAPRTKGGPCSQSRNDLARELRSSFRGVAMAIRSGATAIRSGRRLFITARLFCDRVEQVIRRAGSALTTGGRS